MISKHLAITGHPTTEVVNQVRIHLPATLLVVPVAVTVVPDGPNP